MGAHPHIPTNIKRRLHYGPDGTIIIRWRETELTKQDFNLRCKKVVINFVLGRIRHQNIYHPQTKILL